jgi:hypothetical protein
LSLEFTILVIGWHLSRARSISPNNASEYEEDEDVAQVFASSNTLGMLEY